MCSAIAASITSLLRSLLLLRSLILAFILPRFNLLCNLTGPDVAGVPGIPTLPIRNAGQACSLVYGRRVNVASTGGTASQGTPTACIDLLLPKLADVRGPQDTVSYDMCEVPQGSGRWYTVQYVDDIGKGWPNEHRTAILLALPASWIAPYA